MRIVLRIAGNFVYSIAVGLYFFPKSVSIVAAVCRSVALCITIDLRELRDYVNCVELRELAFLIATA